jgi:multidrug efflux pump subunit AcrA (membrane-fusion protein)
VALVNDRRITLAPVTLGRDFGSNVEIVSGLKGDESVVVNPPDSLTSGQIVRVAAEAGSRGTAP